MARTSQTAHKSTGGSGPCKASGPQQHSFVDHAGKPAVTVWSPSWRNIPRLSIQLYTVCHSNIDAAELGNKFMRSGPIEGWGNARNWWPRIDVYGPLDSVEACMQHHRLEKEFRKDGEERPHQLHIVPNWSRRPYRPYKNVIFIVDELGWEACVEKGVLVAQFDLEVRDEQQIFADDVDDEDDTVLVEKVSYPEDPRIDRAIFDNDAFFKERAAKMEKGDFSDDHRCDLPNVWSELTMALWDCTYRLARCDDCDEGVAHVSCPIREDMHYFNHEGKCIACSNFKGPWLSDDEERTEPME